MISQSTVHDVAQIVFVCCCTDVNECNVSTICPENFICFNTYGSFRCISVLAGESEYCNVHTPYKVSAY